MQHLQALHRNKSNSSKKNMKWHDGRKAHNYLVAKGFRSHSAGADKHKEYED